MKLVNFPDAGGVSATRPTVEAARSLTISPDRRTYTFLIRRGLRFNTGVPVTAASFAHVINRDLNPAMASPAVPYLTDIVGADAVARGRAGHASGVAVLGTYVLRIRLREPAPDFLSRLTLPFLCALPSDTPIAPHGIQAPVPAAGPYYIATWEPGKAAVLRRNPFYNGTRPHRVNEIDYSFGLSEATQWLEIEADQADLGQIPPSAASGLASKYGVNKGRFFVKHQLTLYFLALNRDGHLFRNNDQLARAVNFAIDRRAMAQQHGAFAGTLTDQILPVGLSAFRNWSIYPFHSDYARASLLARGHLRDGKAQLWTYSLGFGPNVAQVVAADLKRIGIATQISVYDPATLSAKAGKRGASYDILIAGWSGDYPDPFEFMNRLLDGDNIQETNNVNFSYFNEPRWNRRMASASRLSGRARDRAYMLLDRDLMTQAAPIAPYLSSNARVFVSARVGCFTYQAVYGTDLAALCLK